jgi:hypothetical protein
MLVSDLFFIAFVYSILFFYRQLISKKRYFLFLGVGTLLWVTFVVLRSSLMKVMMQSIPEVANRKLGEIILSNLPIYFCSIFLWWFSNI